MFESICFAYIFCLNSIYTYFYLICHIKSIKYLEDIMNFFFKLLYRNRLSLIMKKNLSISFFISQAFICLTLTLLLIQPVFSIGILFFKITTLYFLYFFGVVSYNKKNLKNSIFSFIFLVFAIYVFSKI